MPYFPADGPIRHRPGPDHGTAIFYGFPPSIPYSRRRFARDNQHGDSDPDTHPGLSFGSVSGNMLAGNPSLAIITAGIVFAAAGEYVSTIKPAISSRNLFNSCS